MKQLVHAALTLAFGTLALASAARANDYTFDAAHSSAAFKIKHLMISTVPGKFSGFDGKVTIDDQNIGKSSVKATIDAKTVNTDNPKRDDHLRSADFFDVKRYPTIAFESKSIKKQGKDLLVDGALTIHGVTKPVALLVTTLTPEMKDPFGGTRRGMSATTRLNRRDFGLTWNKALEAGGVLVGDDVDIEINAELVKAK
jgi:polyisoprenoid-binding protein YceI